MPSRLVLTVGLGIAVLSLAGSTPDAATVPLNERQAFDARLLEQVDAGDLDSARAFVRAERARVPQLVGSLLAARTDDLLTSRIDAAAIALQRARAVAGLFADVYADSLCLRMLHFYEFLPAERLPAVAACWQRFDAVRALDETSQWAVARDKLPDLLAAARAAEDPYLELRAASLAGRCLFMTGEFDTARERWQESVELAHRLDDRSAEARLLGNVAFTFQAQERPEDAIVILNRAIEAARRLGDRNFLAWCLNATGTNYLIRSELEPARRSYEEALEIARNEGFRGMASEIMGNLANVLAYLGDYDRAIAVQAEGLRVAREMGRENARNSLNAHFMMAWLRSCMGQYSCALVLLQDALPLAETAGATDQVALLHTQLGEVYRELGRPEEALLQYEAAIPVFRRAGIRRFEIWALLSSARVHAEAGRLDASLQELEEARRIAEACGKAQLLVMTGCDLGWVLTLRGELERAESLLAVTLERAEALGNPVLLGTVECRLGRVQAALGHQARAGALFAQAVRRGRQFEAPALLQEALVEEAQWRRASGDLPAADTLLAAAIESVESIRGEQGGEEIRVGFLTTKRPIYTQRIQVLQAIGADEVDHAAQAAAFQVAEQAHARALLDALSGGRPDPGSGVDPVQRERERTLSAKLGRIQTELSRTISGENWERSRFDSLGALLEAARTEYRQVVESIAAGRPAYGATCGQRQPLDLDEVRSRVLQPNQVLLEYVTGEDESFVFLLGRDVFRVARLPEGRAAIRDRVDAFRRAMLAGTAPRPGAMEPEDAAPPVAGILAAGRALHALLVEPIAAFIPDDARLLIVPDGPLFLMPFAALHDGERFLIERHAIAYAPSASILDPRLRRRERRRARSLVAVGNPATFRATEVLATLRGASGWSFGEIPYAEEEAQRVASYFERQEVLLENEATEEAVKAAAGRASHLHFATHGMLDDQEPSMSGLVLAQDADSTEDGILQVHEIQELAISGDLVALSACGSGLGKVADGEGVLGLTWAFLYAGARALLLSLWDIGDRSTVDLIDSFYHESIVAKRPTDVALQAAQRAYLARGRPVREWAAFTIVGTVQTSGAGGRPVWAAFAFGAVVVLLVLAARRAGRKRAPDRPASHPTRYG